MQVYLSWPMSAGVSMNVKFEGLARRVSGSVLAGSLSMSMLLASLPVTVANGAGREAGPRVFAAQALTLRAAGAAGDEEVAGLLARMPGAAIVDWEALPLLWTGFFQNAVVAMGRLNSPAPMALYYSPLLDVGLLTRWAEGEGGYRLTGTHALPGERLSDPAAEAPLQPAWTAAREGPAAALARTAADRLGAFRRSHPAEERAAARVGATFAAAAADLRAALPRLVRNAGRHARWVEAKSWLGPALAAVSSALAAGDAAALRATAPDTDTETAAALASLPEGFISSLLLDAVFRGAGEERLLIGSSPDDGDIYVLIACRMEGGDCALRRFVLLSLLD